MDAADRPGGTPGRDRHEPSGNEWNVQCQPTPSFGSCFTPDGFTVQLASESDFAATEVELALANTERKYSGSWATPAGLPARDWYFRVRATWGYRVVSPWSDTTVLSIPGLAAEDAWQVLIAGNALANPTGIAVDSGGSIYVAEEQSHSVRKFTPDGVRAGDWKGQGLTIIDAPAALAVDRSDNLYIADEAKHQIVRVSPAGTVTAVWACSGAYASGKPTALRAWQSARTAVFWPSPARGCSNSRRQASSSS